MVLPPPHQSPLQILNPTSIKNYLVTADRFPESHCIDLSEGTHRFTPHQNVEILLNHPTPEGTLHWGGVGTKLQVGIICKLKNSKKKSHKKLVSGLFSVMELSEGQALLIRRPRDDSRKLWVPIELIDLNSFVIQDTVTYSYCMGLGISSSQLR